MTAKRARHSKPIIGITCEVTKLKPYYSEFELVCDYRYVRAVIRSGGIPVLLPINPRKRDLNRLLRNIHGLIVTGGSDIPPSFYGEKSMERVKTVYRGRTYFELNLLKMAYKKKIPILGICYGMQLLNVFHGGTLYQDIPTDIQTAKNHRHHRNPFHKVHVKEGSKLKKIFSKKSFLVYSKHHQSVKKLGEKLQISALSEDGVVEAIEGPRHTLAVQWHPECQAKDHIQKKLFRYFIRMCKKID